MSNEKYKPRVPDIVEAVFDIGYLTFAFIAGLFFLVKAQGRMMFELYGILTLTLCGGDAFHLVPRVVRALRGSSDEIKRKMAFGVQVSSITMTAFYVILMYVWKYTFETITAPIVLEVIIWITAIVRIVICFLPQNDWYGEGNMRLSALRNGIFTVTGIGVIILYAISGEANGYHMTRMIAAIIISFGCYLPVTIWSKKKPMIGMLMMPKTCAYIWMIVMGLQILL